MLSDERLAAIRERESKATEGPWCFERWEFGGEIICEYGSLGIEVGKPSPRKRDARSPYDEGLRIADFEFIAAARTDIPDLLREVERLREIEVSARYALAQYEQDGSPALICAMEMLEQDLESPDD